MVFSFSENSFQQCFCLDSTLFGQPVENLSEVAESSCLLEESRSEFSLFWLDVDNRWQLPKAPIVETDQTSSTCHTPPEECYAHQLSSRTSLSFRTSLRTLGAHLDRLFRSMALDILDEASLSFTQVDVREHLCEGIDHQGGHYCLVETFELSHRLKAYCLAQHFMEQGLDYVITASSLRFAIWVEVDAYLGGSGGCFEGA